MDYWGTGSGGFVYRPLELNMADPVHAAPDGNTLEYLKWAVGALFTLAIGWGRWVMSRFRDHADVIEAMESRIDRKLAEHQKATVEHFNSTIDRLINVMRGR